VTPVDRYNARQARLQRISHGVVASYLHDIAAPAPRRRSRAGSERRAARMEGPTPIVVLNASRRDRPGAARKAVPA
jgi:hypothetical protein